MRYILKTLFFTLSLLAISLNLEALFGKFLGAHTAKVAGLSLAALAYSGKSNNNCCSKEKIKYTYNRPIYRYTEIIYDNKIPPYENISCEKKQGDAKTIFDELKESDPVFLRCPKTQVFFKTNPDQAVLAARDIPFPDSIESCFLQALAEAHKEAEKYLIEKSSNQEQLRQKLDYSTPDHNNSKKVQHALRKFEFTTMMRGESSFGEFKIEGHAKSNNQRSGSIQYHIKSDHTAYIDGLETNPNFYRQGIGTALFLKAISHIESSYPDQQSITVSWQVSPFKENLTRQELVWFYESLGAQQDNEHTMSIVLKKN